MDSFKGDTGLLLLVSLDGVIYTLMTITVGLRHFKKSVSHVTVPL